MANEFPTPAFSGPPYIRYFKHVKDYKEITIFSKFEDGGVDTNTSADDLPQRWTFVYQGLTETQAKVLDDHWNSNKLTTKFTLQEPRNEPWTTTGTTYTNLVNYESYEKPEHDRTWIQARTIVLIKYPV